MTDALRLELPWPPSVNHYWRHVASRTGRTKVLISEPGRRYRQRVIEHVRYELGLNRSIDRPCSLIVEAYPPDRRRRDLSNLLKSLEDSLEHAGVVADDYLIADLRVVRRDVVEGGAVVCWIQELADGT